ncbi:MAG: TetR/AcrR family transcriptional regulator, partial [Acidimicrobiales bacterium]
SSACRRGGRLPDLAGSGYPPRTRRRARVAKPTLYAHFPSRAALVGAVLEERHRRQRASLEGYLAERDQAPDCLLLAVFDWLADWQAGEGGRGCAFINAAAELADEADPARAVIAAHKRWLGDQLVGLATEAGLAHPGELGEELLLLVEGANARMLVGGDREAAPRARRAAETLVRAAGRRPARSRSARSRLARSRLARTGGPAGAPAARR